MPLALCIDYSKRRARLEKQIQDADLKGIYRNNRNTIEAQRRGFAGPGTAKRQARLAALPNPPLSTQVDDGLGDGAFSLDGLGVGLIVALGHDQVHQLVGQLDVGILQCTSLNSA